MADLGERIVVLIDMDCFFCQVEAKLNPELKGKPSAVVQYSSFGPGGIIAVNYEARDFGVTRHMRGDEAREKCPDIQLVTVPPLRNKPDTGRYRTAGKEVIDALKKHCTIIERASVDEAYIDITDLVDKKMAEMSSQPQDLAEKLSNTFVVGYCDYDSNDEEIRKEGVNRWLGETFDDLGDIQSRKLAIGGLIVEFLRAEIYAQCEYRCSAGISYNKILAKLACGLHKPNRQTILPASAVPALYSSLPVNKVRNLGGKFGNIVMESLGCNVMADLLRYSQQDLLKKFDEKTCIWLYNIARGIDNEPVTPRLVCKSIGASKNFPGKQAITKPDVLEHWANELAIEIVDRLEQDLEENQRRATSLTVGFHYYQDRKVISQSRVCSLNAYKVEKIVSLCVDVVTKGTKKPIAFLGMSAGKFIPIKGSEGFKNFFKAGPSTKTGGSTDKANTIVPKAINVSTIDEDIEHKDILITNSESNEKKVNKNNINQQSIAVNESYKSNKPNESFKNQEGGNSSLSKDKNDEIVPSVHSNINENSSSLNNTDLNKTLNEDLFKGSFFMNFLNLKPPATSLQITEVDGKGSEEKKEEINEQSIVYNSPDIFDDLESPMTSTYEEVRNVKNTENANSVNNDALIQLKEIFPDMDNIDPSVMQLLPIELQREANTYLKSKKIKEMKNGKEMEGSSVKMNGKNGTTKLKMKTKVSEKSSKKNSCIYNFFVKNSEDINNSEMKQCPECNQMIRLEKFREHSDYHIAQTLHRSINQTNNQIRNPPVINSPAAKRKISSVDNIKTKKKARSIDSFFTS